jgi:hypothetical protein
MLRCNDPIGTDKSCNLKLLCQLQSERIGAETQLQRYNNRLDNLNSLLLIGFVVMLGRLTAETRTAVGNNLLFLSLIENIYRGKTSVF